MRLGGRLSGREGSEKCNLRQDFNSQTTNLNMGKQFTTHPLLYQKNTDLNLEVIKLK